MMFSKRLVDLKLAVTVVSYSFSFQSQLLFPVKIENCEIDWLVELLILRSVVVASPFDDVQNTSIRPSLRNCSFVARANASVWRDEWNRMNPSSSIKKETNFTGQTARRRRTDREIFVNTDSEHTHNIIIIHVVVRRVLRRCIFYTLDIIIIIIIIWNHYNNIIILIISSNSSLSLEHYRTEWFSIVYHVDAKPKHNQILILSKSTYFWSLQLLFLDFHW
jgi:hypothetical protein